MSFSEKSNAPSKLGPRTIDLYGPIIGVAALLAIAFWLVEAYLHSRAEGITYTGQLFARDTKTILERLAFAATIALYTGFVLIFSRKAHRRKERAERETDLKRIAVMQNIQEHILLHDRSLTVLWANKAAGDSVELKPEEIVGRHCYEIWHQRGEPCVVCPVLRAMETGAQQANEVMTPDGRWFYIKGYPVHDDRGKIVGAVEITLEITALKQAEAALAREKEHLAVTLASIGDGVIATDMTGAITFVNRAAEKLTGWSQYEALGRKLEIVFKLIDERTRMPRADPMDTVRRTGMTSGLPVGTILISRDGTERLIADSGAPIKDPDGRTIGMILVFRDITERRRLEEEILKSQKLESLGVLAGGIAHDFNNILTAILGNASVARLSMSPEDKGYATLSDIEKAASRARKLTQQLLTFSKGGAPVKKVTSLNEIIRDTVRFALSGSNVSATFDLPDDLWPVSSDADQISHAINNIAINAREAMPRGGTIDVRLENVDVTNDTTLPLSPRRYVRITIRDHGVGIPREHLAKIFDPYFTTKEELHSGLGLAVAYFVVKKHGGHIAVESEPGVSTTFSIYLPAEHRETLAPPPSEPRPAPRGHGKILVMDDEEIVRGVLGKILGRFGYEAEFARDGMEALDKYRAAMASAKPFDAVIMDLTVTGGMGGKEAIKLLRVADPNAKVVVSSGYSDDPVVADFRKYGFNGVIAKPFRADELNEVLSNVLDSQRALSREERSPR